MENKQKTNDILIHPEGRTTLKNTTCGDFLGKSLIGCVKNGLTPKKQHFNNKSQKVLKLA